MGFPKKVKEEALRLSARHCCVCHRYKGVKMEVHHLVQEADGGENLLSNAIPLCFDCHSDAGHFNNRHPKGSKFSITELIKSRDNWYNYVSENSISEKIIISDQIHTSFFVLDNFEILEKTLNGDFSSINKFRSRIYLATNHISKFWIELLRTHKIDFKSNIEQNKIIEICHFHTLKDYQDTYQNVILLSKESDIYPSYVAKRKVSWEELLKIDIPNSFLTILNNTGINVEEVCISLLHENGESCGGEYPGYGFTEYLEIVPLSFIFMGITNASTLTKQIKLNMLKTDTNSLNLPNFSIQKSEMVLVPILTVANLVGIDKDSITFHHKDGDRGEDFSKIFSMIDFSPDKLVYIGDQVKPKSIVYNDNEGEYEVEVHKLDFENLYLINSYWQCGSCPHLFFKTSEGKQRYSRELLVASSNGNGIDEFLVPPLISHVIIRELEDEITYIDKIIVNGNVVLSNIILAKGDFLEFPVSSHDKIVIYGKYIPLRNNATSPNDLWTRNHLVSTSNKLNNNIA